MRTEPTFEKRAVGVGILKPKDAIELCAVGPTLRGSGIKNDVRADDPYAAYDEVPFQVITHDGCDVLCRTLTRCEEMLESINIIRYALDHMPEGELRLKVPIAVPAGEAISRVEAPRGELMHYARSNGSIKPERYIPALCKTLMGCHMADIPIILAGIDPCFSCMDRMAFVDVKTNSQWASNMQELRRNAKA
jgi:NADH-quinone oxidoreductase subunit D